MFPQIFGKYMLEREIGAGGMARVYLATLRGAGGFEKRLVVKQIRPELASDQGFVERFVKEAKTAVELSHPNIVPVYELGVEQGVYYIAMEHCDGATLSEVLGATGPLDPEEGAYLGVEVCRALDYAHRRVQVIHRDVTPRNVLIDEEGAVRLIDFGIAAPVADVAEETRTEVFGSPGHMPPEQMEGLALTPATDVFAVGVLLYEALTGRPAFRRGNAKESRAALYETQPPLDEGHPELSPLTSSVSAAMHLTEGERPANAEALGRTFREFLRGSDSGDIARRLGRRVEAQRQLANEASPWLMGEGLTGLGSQAPLPDGTRRLASEASASGTRTFATSPRLAELTRRLESDPPPAPAGSTPSALSQGAPSQGAPSQGAPAAARPNSRAERPSRVTLGVAVGLPVALVSLALLWSWGAGGPSEPTRAPEVLATRPAETLVARTRAPAAAEVRPVVETGVLPLPSAAAERPLTRSGLGPRERVRSSSVAPEPAASETAPALAHLSLTALPGTEVNVAGQAYVTPVRDLSLAPGPYRVTFRSATWDGPVSTQIVLAPGVRSHVHADFTNEPPRVVVR